MPREPLAVTLTDELGLRLRGMESGSPWEELTQTTDHHPLPSVEDQLCRGRVVVLDVVCCCPLGAQALGLPGGGVV